MALRVQTLLSCPCCGRFVDRFLPIPESYIRQCEAMGVEHPLDAWETLNLEAYLCPHCGATDRDRLQVLFLKEYLSKFPLPLDGCNGISSPAEPPTRFADSPTSPTEGGGDTKTKNDKFPLPLDGGGSVNASELGWARNELLIPAEPPTRFADSPTSPTEGGGDTFEPADVRNARVRVLEIAPSPPVSNWLRAQPNVAYRSADLEMTSADDKVDVTDMSCYPDSRFDVVICSHVLEHVPDDLKAMREIRRVLAPCGVALLLVPISTLIEDVLEDPTCTDQAERWRRFGQGDHIRIYGQFGFIKRLTDSGLNAKQFSPETKEISGLTSSSTLYVGIGS